MRGREEEGEPFFLAFLPFLAALALMPRRDAPSHFPSSFRLFGTEALEIELGLIPNIDE